MTDSETITRVIESADQRRVARRHFLRSASVAGLAIGGSSLLAACGSGDKNKSTPTPTPTGSGSPSPTPTATPTFTDPDVLQLALNYEYLEAQFFLHAAFGSGLDSTLTAGATDSAAAGAVTGGKKVSFTDTTLAEYAREIAADERAHVTFLRTQLASSVIAMPDINIDGGADGAFTAAARLAGIVGTGGTFDPYASDDNFLIAAFLLEDIGPTLYKGALAYMTNSILIEAVAGLIATEAHHAGLIRSTLYSKSIATPSLITSAEKLSNARDTLDGAVDDDQGLAGTGGASNVTPADNRGIIYARTPQQLLNIAFLSADSKTTKGGFFPSGIKGTIAST